MKIKNHTYVFILAGGIGKNVMATAVIESFKHAHVDSRIIIATAHPFVWTNNPDIDEIVDLNFEFSLYTRKLKGKEYTVFGHDVYHTEDFIYKKNNLIDAWCKLLEIEPITHQPKLFLSASEIDAAKKKLFKKVSPTKLLFFIQTNGGAPQQAYPISWARDLPLSIAQKVVDEMNKKGYETIHIRRNNQPSLENATWLDAEPREIMAMLPLSKKRLFIDSFPQHAAAALKLSSVVTWITNTPKVFGYTTHTNIVSDVPHSFRHYPQSYLELYDITGALEQCPFDTDMLFDADDILKKLS